jgi:hypothetical protein
VWFSQRLARINTTHAEQVAEKVGSATNLVGQALLPVRVLLYLRKMDSQEWLSYWTSSAASEAFATGPPRNSREKRGLDRGNTC